MCIIDIAVTETSLIWMVTNKESGGLEYDEKKIGMIAISNAFFGLLSVPLLWYLENKIKKNILMKLCIILIDGFIIFMPFIDSSNSGFIILCIFSSIRAIIVNILFNLIYAFISAYNKVNIGKVNGISQSLSGLSKIISPIIFTNIYSWSISQQFKLNQYINYHFTSYLLVIMSIIPLLLSSFLTNDNNNDNNDSKL